jgi:hypothetical protein
MEGDAGVNASSEGLAGVAHVAKQESKTQKSYENTSLNYTGDKRTGLGSCSAF